MLENGNRLVFAGRSRSAAVATGTGIGPILAQIHPALNHSPWILPPPQITTLLRISVWVATAAHPYLEGVYFLLSTKSARKAQTYKLER